MRFDFTIRTDADRERVVASIKSGKLSEIHLTHNSKTRTPLQDGLFLRNEFPKLGITMHLSMAMLEGGNFDESHTTFRKIIESAISGGVSDFLIVSGYPRVPFDTLDAIQFMHAQGMADGATVMCVYNPFFDPARLREEHVRLERKLSYPFVKSIAFQIGVDMGKLKKGVDQVRAIRADVELLASLPVPTSAMLRRLQENPLYGVFLPQSFLSREASALEVTRDVLKTYHQHKVIPLIYTLEGDMKDIELAKSLDRAK